MLFRSIIGVVILIYTQDIRVIRSATVSPRIIPQIVGVASLLVGVWYAIDIIRTPHEISGGEDSEDVDIDAPTDWRALTIIAIGLTVFAFIVEPAGFALAAAVFIGGWRPVAQPTRPAPWARSSWPGTIGTRPCST